MQFIIGIPIKYVFKHISVPVICSVLMGTMATALRMLNTSLIWNMISILICVILYLTLLLLFKSSREDIVKIIEKMATSKRQKKCC